MGANEAGKTSLLEAMVHISSDQPFHAREHTRDTVVNNEEEMVRAEFSLDEEDRDLLGDLVPADMDLTYGHHRYPEGNSKYSISPPIPRDRTHRDQAAAALRQALDDGWLEKLDAPDEAESGGGGEDEEGAQRLFKRASALAGELDSREDWLPGPVRQELAAFAAVIEQDVPEGVDTDQSELARLLGLAAHFENETP
ncbi:MAG TPA: hypothetical protein VGI24_01525, partial [Solirubrobacteraceae bacterium]